MGWSKSDGVGVVEKMKMKMRPGPVCRDPCIAYPEAYDTIDL